VAHSPGEVVLFSLDHIGFLQEMAKLQRPLAGYFRQNFWEARRVTPSSPVFGFAGCLTNKPPGTGPGLWRSHEDADDARRTC
jgi:hypothetical protein